MDECKPLETGAVVIVPLFIQIDEEVIINTVDARPYTRPLCSST